MKENHHPLYKVMLLFLIAFHVFVFNKKKKIFFYKIWANIEKTFKAKPTIEKRVMWCTIFFSFFLIAYHNMNYLTKAFCFVFPVCILNLYNFYIFMVKTIIIIAATVIQAKEYVGNAHILSLSSCCARRTHELAQNNMFVTCVSFRMILWQVSSDSDRM